MAVKNFSVHNIWLTLPLTTCTHGLNPDKMFCERSAIDVGKMAGKSHMIETMVYGYHVYKEIWCAAVGEKLSCIREVENYRNPFAVAVVR